MLIQFIHSYVKILYASLSSNFSAAVNCVYFNFNESLSSYFSVHLHYCKINYVLQDIIASLKKSANKKVDSCSFFLTPTHTKGTLFEHVRATVALFIVPFSLLGWVVVVQKKKKVLSKNRETL